MYILYTRGEEHYFSVVVFLKKMFFFFFIIFIRILRTHVGTIYAHIIIFSRSRKYTLNNVHDRRQTAVDRFDASRTRLQSGAGSSRIHIIRALICTRMCVYVCVCVCIRCANIIFMPSNRVRVYIMYNIYCV